MSERVTETFSNYDLSLERYAMIQQDFIVRFPSEKDELSIEDNYESQGSLQLWDPLIIFEPFRVFRGTITEKNTQRSHFRLAVHLTIVRWFGELDFMRIECNDPKQILSNNSPAFMSVEARDLTTETVMRIGYVRVIFEEENAFVYVKKMRVRITEDVDDEQ